MLSVFYQQILIPAPDLHYPMPSPPVPQPHVSTTPTTSLKSPCPSPLILLCDLQYPFAFLPYPLPLTMPPYLQYPIYFYPGEGGQYEKSFFLLLQRNFHHDINNFYHVTDIFHHDITRIKQFINQTTLTGLGQFHGNVALGLIFQIEYSWKWVILSVGHTFQVFKTF